MRPTEHEIKFINEKTRQQMVEWADTCLRDTVLDPQQFNLESDDPYIQHAFKKGWLTKREPRRLTASGWKVAAAFLKR